MEEANSINHKFQAIVTNISKGEEEIIEFFMPLPSSTSNPELIASKLLNLLLNQDDTDAPEYIIKSVKKIHSIVSIEVEPICPN